MHIVNGLKSNYSTTTANRLPSVENSRQPRQNSSTGKIEKPSSGDKTDPSEKVSKVLYDAAVKEQLTQQKKAEALEQVLTKFSRIYNAN